MLAEGVLIIDEQERIILANKSFAARIGEEPEYLTGKNPSIFNWDLCGDELEELPWHGVLKRDEDVVGMPLKIQVDNEQITFTANAAAIKNEYGELKGVLTTFDDVTPLEAKNEELAKMLAELSSTKEVIEEKNRELEILATRDSLTGCLNRRSFFQIYKDHFLRAQREEMALSVLMVDIDHFKKVNDNHGHPVGDKVIKLVAGVLQAISQPSDAVGRYGGEEFAFSLAGVGLDESLQIAERIKEKIATLPYSEELPFDTLTVSVGVACFGLGLSDHTELLDQADRALYKAKETGRNRVCLFDPEYAGTTHQTVIDDKTLDFEDTDSKEANKLRKKLESMDNIIRKQADELTRRAMHDELTGLPNRYLLIDRLTQAMKLSKRNKSITAIVSISLSKFEHINNICGHSASEEMLKQAVDRLDNIMRAVDSIGVSLNEQSLTFSRLSHNELAMLLVDLNSVDSVPKIVKRITRALESPFTISNEHVINNVYCGIALFPYDGIDPNILIRNATLARSSAERHDQHHSGSAYFSKKIGAQVIKNARIAVELQKAIKEDGLNVVYQPKVESDTNLITGVEALARWNNHEFSDVGPMEFISIAESIGVIDQLTNWMLTRVCKDIKNGNLEGMRVSINVSPIELHDPSTADRILNIIRDNGVSPTQLEIEITESSILNNFERARDILENLQDHGVLVALDDFGTAYSSLNLLLEIPVDTIKIDRSFVAGIQNAPYNQAVVSAIIQMAQSMGKRIVAEGAETTKERDCLTMLGCREIQGYLYSKPLSLEELISYKEKFGVFNLDSEETLTQSKLKRLRIVNE